MTENLQSVGDVIDGMYNPPKFVEQVEVVDRPEIVTDLSPMFAKQEDNAVKRYNATSGQLNVKDGYNCPLCKNKGYIAFRRPGETMTIKECECMLHREHLDIIATSGMGELVHKSLDQFVAKKPYQFKMKERAKNYLDKQSRSWFVLCGQSGCGKTHIASCIANDYLFNRKERLMYVSWASIIPTIRKEEYDWDKSMDDSTTVEFNLKHCPVLFIDDLFKGSQTDNDKKLTYRIIDYRYVNSLPTIITTELMLDEIKALDEAIARRIYESAKGYVLQISKSAERDYSFQ